MVLTSDDYKAPEGQTLSSYNNLDNHMQDTISNALDQMILTLSAYRDVTGDQDINYGARKRRRRKNDKNKNKVKMDESSPKLRAILAILENEQIDESKIGKRDLEAMYEMLRDGVNEETDLEPEEQIKELHVDQFF